MNTMQAVMKMLEGETVSNGYWLARIRDGLLGVTLSDNPGGFKSYGDEVGLRPKFENGGFVDSCDNCSWTIYEPAPPPPPLFLRDLSHGDKFSFGKLGPTYKLVANYEREKGMFIQAEDGTIHDCYKTDQYREVVRVED